MTGDEEDFRPLDPGRINTDDPAEIRYWCRQLRCDEGTLRSAIAAAGNHVAAVRDQLAARE